MPADPFELKRFVDAQASAYVTACRELEQGRKQSHWIWFIFPQLRGLGRSATAQYYAISGRAEAEAYLAHPILGPRLDHVTRLMLAIEGKAVGAVLPFPDDLKFHSSMTLFAAVSPGDSPFARALEKFFDGRQDPQTLKLIA